MTGTNGNGFAPRRRPPAAFLYNTRVAPPILALGKVFRMKPRLLTPGPTPVPEETLLELAKPVTYHRAPEFRALLAEVTEDLKYVFQTKNSLFVLTASGTGGMEAAVANCCPAGSKAIGLICGRFSERWRNLCK